MFEQDYLMRMLLQLLEAMTRANQRASRNKDPRGAADLLEGAIGDALEMDSGVLLSLSPSSIASIMKVSGTDPHVMSYVAHTMLLQAEFLKQCHEDKIARLREDQAKAIAQAYDIDLILDMDEFRKMLEAEDPQKLIFDAVWDKPSENQETAVDEEETFLTNYKETDDDFLKSLGLEISPDADE